MTERWRQRRLHVENRLAELNAKHGQLLPQQLPEWLDSFEGYLASIDVTPEESPAPAPMPVPPSSPPAPAETGAVWDREPI